MMNSRQQRFLNRIKERNGSFPENSNPMLRDAAQFLAFAPERSLAQIRAFTIYESAKRMPLAFDPDSRLAGEHFNHGSGDTAERDDAEKQRFLDMLGDFQLATIRETAQKLRQRFSAVSAGECTPGGAAGKCTGWLHSLPGEAAPVFLSAGWKENHSIRDYAFLLKHGFGGIRRRIEHELERGRDITDGGAEYNWHSICLLGVPDTADCLIALKKLLFEERRITPGELLDAMKQDFKGNEPLRELLRNRAPKYGNGDDETDRLAAGLSRDFIALMDRWSEPANRIFVHLFSFYFNVYFGENVGAMPDGRHAGEPLAYSLSPHQGRDSEGVTMLLRSLAKQPHREAAGGSAAIIDLHPSLFAGESGEQRFVALLRSALEMGIGQMQWNVVSAERLEQAKRDPEHYGNIPVRVAGYSQLFKLIPSEIQDHLIARTKHRR